MSEKSKGNVLVMSGGKTRWTPGEKILGGVDLEKLSEGQLFVLPEGEELIGSADSYTRIDDAGIEMGILGLDTDAFANAGEVLVAVNGSVWPAAAVNKTEFDDIIVYWVGNPALSENLNIIDQPDNGLPFFVGLVPSGAIACVDPERLYGNPNEKETQTNWLEVYTVTSKRLAGLKALLLAAVEETSGSCRYIDWNNSEVKTPEEVYYWLSMGRPVWIDGSFIGGSLFGQVIAVSTSGSLRYSVAGYDEALFEVYAYPQSES